MKNLKNYGFTLPDYQGGCIANLPGTILSLFGLSSGLTPLRQRNLAAYRQKFSKVFLFWLDGLGYDRYQKILPQLPFFRRLQPALPLTSTFPSTTAAVSNSLCTGLTPAQHGLFEWTLYLPEIDQRIKTLPFQNESTGQILDGAYPARVLLSRETVFQKLARRQIPSFCFLSHKYAFTAYSSVAHAGSEIVPFLNFSDLSIALIHQLNTSSGFFFAYWDQLDTLSHFYGPDSEACFQETLAFDFYLHQIFQNLTPETKKETLFIFVTDHGQIACDSRQAIHLEQDPLLMDSLALDQKGQPLLPCGGHRDPFLHLKKEKIAACQKHLAQKFKNHVLAVKPEDLLAANLFGAKTTPPKFRSRLGNLILLPLQNQSFVWNPQKTYQGQHGGLSREEMLVPLILQPLSKVKP